jgi:hypothetical protein
LRTKALTDEGKTLPTRVKSISDEGKPIFDEGKPIFDEGNDHWTRVNMDFMMSTPPLNYDEHELLR